ncbi:uncharacterized protein [Panulirus ornatus]|uniref:uncharacterized protein n=1 Tax=Panulirus ornatus TaxID=150431 RepID=UPI003A85454F
MARGQQVYLHLLLVFVFASATAQRGDRWVWPGQRPARGTHRSKNPSAFLPPVSPRASPVGISSLPLLLAPSASSKNPRRRAPTSRSSFISRPKTNNPFEASPLSRLQGPLVFRPLPIDISKLPLETSDEVDSLDSLVTNTDILSQDLSEIRSQRTPDIGLTNTRFSQTLPNLNFGRPSSALRQPEPSLVQTLVTMPDISKLPLETSSSSSSFSSFSSFANTVDGQNATIPRGVNAAVPSSVPSGVDSDDILEGEGIDSIGIRSGRHLLEVFQQPQTGASPNPSATPVPSQIFLKDFILDDSPFLKSANIEGNRIFKASSFEALEEFAFLNSKAIEQAFQNFKQIPADTNDIKAVAGDPVIFPKRIENLSSASNGSPIQVVDPPELGVTFGVRDATFAFPVPQLQPEANRRLKPISLAAANLRPNRSSQSQRPESREAKSVSLFLKKNSDSKKERGGLSYIWLWPNDTHAINFLTRSATFGL